MRGVLFVAAVCATAVVHAGIDPSPHELEGDDFVPRPEWAELFSMGFSGVVADVHWLRAVQVAGDSHEDPSIHSEHLGRLIDVVTHLDPWVDHPYRFAGIWMTKDDASVREAIRLLERGIEHHPDDWRMYFYKGFDHFYYLNEHAQAADVLELAIGLDGAPAYLGRLVARLRSQSADIDAAAVFLQQMIQTATDDYTRGEYQGALDEIEVERAARFLDRARAAFQKLNGRDIRHVANLLSGEHPVLRALPPAEPSSLPQSLRSGSRWELGEDGRILSTYYGRRYEVNFTAVAKKDLATRRTDPEAAAAETEGGGHE